MSLEENMEDILNMEVEPVKKPNVPKVQSKDDYLDKDYEYTR